ncbi:MAG: hypothetical protein AAGA42_11440 [Actinomycetota bacterium]
MTAGELTIEVADRVTVLDVDGGAHHELPVGPLSLVDDVLGAHDPPRPADLTNALGLVADHLDDVLIEAPSLLAPADVAIAGDHAEQLARVERGSEQLPDALRLRRDDIDEVFRTVATESRDDRRYNPGLGGAYVDAIVGTCCVVLAIIRRLELDDVAVRVAAGGRAPEAATP